MKGPAHQLLQRAKGNFQAFTEPFYFIEKLGQTMEKFLLWRYHDARKLQDEMLGGRDEVGPDGKITRTQGIAQVLTANWENLPKEMRIRRFEPVDMTLLPRRPGLRVDWEADRQWMWMVHMMMGSESGKDRLTKGYGWSEEQVRAFLKANKMSEAEADFIQSIHDMFDKDLWGRIVEVYTRNHGAPPKRTDAAAFTMEFERPDGTTYTKEYRGGYTPVRYKDSFSYSSKDPDKFLMKDIYAGNEAAESVRASFTFARDEGITSNEVPILDWSLLPSHIAGVVHYVAFDAYVRDAAKILGDSRMKGIIQDRVGEKGREQINAWLKDLAQDNLQPLRQATRDGWWWFNKAKSMFVNSVIMYNIPVFMGDVFPGPLVAIFNREVGARYILPSMMHALKDPVTGWGMRNLALDNSTVIPHRSNKSLELFRDIVYETSRYGKRGSGKPGSVQFSVTEKFNSVKHFIRHNGWVLMDIGDKMVSTVIWDAGFKQALAKAKAEGRDLQDPAVYEAAVRAADKNVEHSLPSRDRSELPAMLREQQSMGNLVVFFGYASKMWQMTRRNWTPVYEHWRTQMEAEGRRAGKEQLVRDIISTTPEFVIAASYMLGFMALTGPVAEFVSGRGPEDDETKGQWLGRKLVSHPLQMIHPTTGWLGEMLGAGLVGKKQMPLLSMRTSPAASGLQRVVNGVTKAMSQPSGRAGRDPHARMWAALDALLTMQSLPASQPTRTLKFLDGWLVDNTETQNPFAGIIYGPEKRASNLLRWPKR
jgi:hypothetical protein